MCVSQLNSLDMLFFFFFWEHQTLEVWDEYYLCLPEMGKVISVESYKKKPKKHLISFQPPKN